MSDTAVYTEPQYLLPEPTTALLSEARPLHFSTEALLCLNYLLDELLHLIVVAALSGGSGGPSSTLTTPANNALGQFEVFTTERFKNGLNSVVGTQMGKDAGTEAELAVRDLLRLSAPSMRGDPALRKSVGARTPVRQNSTVSLATSAQADDVFRSLRAFIQIISGLGVACPQTGPSSVSNHLMAITPPPHPPSPSSPHLTFLTALYAERCLTYIADYIIKAVGRVTERESRKEAAGLKELEAALSEDQLLWGWLKDMRVRAYIESEIAIAQAKSPTASGQGNGSLVRRATVSGGGHKSSRGSYESTGASSGISYGKKDAGLGISDQVDDGFDQLMSSGHTMKLSLTPDRLRGMEKRDKRRPTVASIPSSASMPSLATVLPASPPLSVGGSRRLLARNARKRDPIDEDDDEEELDEPTHRKPKESLMDILGTPPPWPENGEKFSSPNLSSRQGSIGRKSAVGSNSPASAAMSPQISQNSYSSMGSEPAEFEQVSPQTRQKFLKAKDERADLAHERQINYDLVDFFANSPPPPPPRIASVNRELPPAIVSQSTTSLAPSTKKKAGWFMSKVKGNNSKSRESDAMSLATSKSSNDSQNVGSPPLPTHSRGASRRGLSQSDSQSPPISPTSFPDQQESLARVFTASPVAGSALPSQPRYSSHKREFSAESQRSIPSLNASPEPYVDPLAGYTPLTRHSVGFVTSSSPLPNLPTLGASVPTGVAVPTQESGSEDESPVAIASGKSNSNHFEDKRASFVESDAGAKDDAISKPPPTLVANAEPKHSSQEVTVGSTLLALKLRMTYAQSPEECVSLLDAYLKLNNENKRASTRTPVDPTSTVYAKSRAEDALSADREDPEAHDAYVAEFFLSSGSFKHPLLNGNLEVDQEPDPVARDTMVPITTSLLENVHNVVNSIRPRMHQITWNLPNAGSIPVTANKGLPMSAWFNINTLDTLGQTELPTDEDEEGLMLAVERVHKIVASEKAKGIEPKRIILSGFSQGCAVVLLAGLSSPEELGGVMCLSGWLPLSNKIFEANGTKMHEIQTDHATKLDVWWGHGNMDPTVPYSWGRKSAELLKELGFREVDFHTYDGASFAYGEWLAAYEAFLTGLNHWTNEQEEQEMGDWLVRRLPLA
ncbi:phospholipase/carboxylesterase, partial [Phenoliferia sp. Uapishka_3]